MKMNESNYIQGISKMDFFLKDVLSFFNDVISILPDKYKKDAKSLLSRTEEQIKSLETVFLRESNDEDEPEYIEAVAETKMQIKDPIKIDPIVSHPYVDLPATELRNRDVTKIGPLCRRERRFSIITQIQRYYVGLIDQWILLYTGEKASKPCQAIDVYGYEAIITKNATCKQKDCCFEIISVEGRKSHQFIARTAKDMEQWVVFINDASKLVSEQKFPEDETATNKKTALRELPSIPISTRASVSTDDEIYAKLDNEYQMMHSNHQKTTQQDPDFENDFYVDVGEIKEEIYTDFETVIKEKDKYVNSNFGHNSSSDTNDEDDGNYCEFENSGPVPVPPPPPPAVCKPPLPPFKGIKNVNKKSYSNRDKINQSRSVRDNENSSAFGEENNSETDFYEPVESSSGSASGKIEKRKPNSFLYRKKIK